MGSLCEIVLHHPRPWKSRDVLLLEADGRGLAFYQAACSE
jgi:hypothetical protein